MSSLAIGTRTLGVSDMLQTFDRNGNQVDARPQRGHDGSGVPVVGYGYTLAVQRSDAER